MSLYGRIFAAMYDTMMKGTEEATFAVHRRGLLSRISGRVVEIGGGTGANLPYYGPDVTEIAITEPEEPMARRLEGKLKLSEHSLAARVVRAPAEELPFEDGSFDYAVSTLVLCTVDDPGRALAEIRRVLRPSGQLVFLEHVRADDPKLATWQDRLQPLQYRLGHGCHCNRPTLSNIEGSGFQVAELEHDKVKKAPPIVRPLIAGVASLPTR
jgi:ubiquinone/menaquinone biosynthesis C-methylase UbiE